MRDAQVIRLAGEQFNRISRVQLEELGCDANAVRHLVRRHRLVLVEQAVFAIPPVLDDDWGRWMGATLTAPGTVLSHFSAAAAWQLWSRPRALVTVTRAGHGGPRQHGGLWVHRSTTLEGNTQKLRGIPITTVPRTALDLAPRITTTALARLVRDAIRLKVSTLAELFGYCAQYRGTRGTGHLRAVLIRYAGLPLRRARSGAEVRAIEVLRDARFVLPDLNYRIAGEEADLSWPSVRAIIEIDGGPFHLDRGGDARKQAIWEHAGWAVRRIPSDDVYESPHRLVALASSLSVPRCCL
jgi:very-short-patch-repair endonuclease